MKYAVGIVIGLLLAAIACAWLEHKPRLSSVLASAAKELANEETTIKEYQKVVVYRDKVKKKLDLPAAIQKDPDKHVVAASPIPPSDYPHTMTAVYDSGTGAVDMFLRQDPLPWLAFNRRGAIGAAYGFKDGVTAARIYGRLDLLQIKRLHAGLMGNADSDGGWFGGGFVEARW